MVVVFVLLVVDFFVDESTGFFDVDFFAVAFAAAVFLVVVFALLTVDFLVDETAGFSDAVDFALVEAVFFGAGVVDLTAVAGTAFFDTVFVFVVVFFAVAADFFEVEVSVLFIAAVDFPGNAIESISTREYF